MIQDSFLTLLYGVRDLARSSSVADLASLGVATGVVDADGVLVKDRRANVNDVDSPIRELVLSNN
jgi:hypothetical protein